jgi:hypothetical protein
MSRGIEPDVDYFLHQHKRLVSHICLLNVALQKPSKRASSTASSMQELHRLGGQRRGASRLESTVLCNTSSNEEQGILPLRPTTPVVHQISNSAIEKECETSASSLVVTSRLRHGRFCGVRKPRAAIRGSRQESERARADDFGLHWARFWLYSKETSLLEGWAGL